MQHTNRIAQKSLEDSSTLQRCQLCVLWHYFCFLILQSVWAAAPIHVAWNSFDILRNLRENNHRFECKLGFYFLNLKCFLFRLENNHWADQSRNLYFFNLKPCPPSDLTIFCVLWGQAENEGVWGPRVSDMAVYCWYFLIRNCWYFLIRNSWYCLIRNRYGVHWCYCLMRKSW